MEMANLSNNNNQSCLKHNKEHNLCLQTKLQRMQVDSLMLHHRIKLISFLQILGTQVAQFNATQANAQAQFNAGQANTVERFNAELNNQRDQFNAQNQLVIGQSNAKWRRQIATADTAGS